MNMLIKLLEFVLGIACLIAWVTGIAMITSKILPKKIRKKTLNLKDFITIAGVGMFSGIFTLIFFFFGAKLGLESLMLSKIMAELFSNWTHATLAAWAGRLLTISLTVTASFFYAYFFFDKINLRSSLKGLLFSLFVFAIGGIAVFPALSSLGHFTSSVPSFFGENGGNINVILTFLAGTLVFGALVSGIYHQWDEA